MKEGWTKYIVFILVLFLIVMSLIIIKKKQTKEEIEVKESALRLEDTTNYTEELKVDNTSFVIKTKSSDAYLIENYQNKYLFYADNNMVKVFNTEENKTYSIDKLMPDYSTDFVIDNDDYFIGVIYSTDLNEHNSFLLIDGNKTLYYQEYDYLVYVGNYLTANRYDENGNQIGAYLLNASDERKPLIKKEYKTSEYYGFYELGNKYITFEYDNITEVYNSESLNLIYKTKSANSVDNKGNSKFAIGTDSKDNIYIYNNGLFSILDSKGNVIKENDKINECVDLIDKYVLNTEDKKITITDIDNNIIQIATLENGNLDYYEFINSDNKEGILFIVFDSKVSYKDVYDQCNNNECKGITFDEFKKDYKDKMGYQYFFDYKTKKISKTPTIVVSSNEID